MGMQMGIQMGMQAMGMQAAQMGMGGMMPPMMGMPGMGMPGMPGMPPGMLPGSSGRGGPGSDFYSYSESGDGYSSASPGAEEGPPGSARRGSRGALPPSDAHRGNRTKGRPEQESAADASRNGRRRVDNGDL